MANNEIPFLAEMIAVGPHAPPLEQKTRLLRDVRALSDEMASRVDCYLLDRMANLHNALLESKACQEKCKALLEKMAAPPWFLGVYLYGVPTPQGPRGMVMCQSALRMVSFAEGLDPASLSLGDEVFLSSNLNIVMSRCTERMARCGETALFDRFLSFDVHLTTPGAPRH